MAIVEIMKEYKGEDGLQRREKLFPKTPNYPESPLPRFAIDSPGGVTETTFARTENPHEFDVFQRDPSVTKETVAAEKVDHDWYVHVGIIKPGEPLVLHHPTLDNTPTTLQAVVVPDAVSLPLHATDASVEAA